MTQQTVHILGMQEEFSKCGIEAKNDDDDECYIAEIKDTMRWIRESEKYRICKNCKLNYFQIICDWSK